MIHHRVPAINNILSKRRKRGNTAREMYPIPFFNCFFFPRLPRVILRGRTSARNRNVANPNFASFRRSLFFCSGAILDSRILSRSTWSFAVAFCSVSIASSSSRFVWSSFSRLASIRSAWSSFFSSSCFWTRVASSPRRVWPAVVNAMDFLSSSNSRWIPRATGVFVMSFERIA